MFEEQIEKGMTYLDKKLPGWENGVNLSILDVRSCLTCLCGQILGVDACCDIMDAHPWFMQARGFVVIGSSAHYPALNAEWKQAILKRREEHVKTEEATRKSTLALQQV